MKFGLNFYSVFVGTLHKICPQAILLICNLFCLLSQIPQGQTELLPVNFFINNLLSLVALHNNSEGICTDLECDICDSGDSPVNRCTTCSYFLCDFCSQAHRRGRNTRSHSLMSLDETRKMGSAAVAKPSLCKEHDGEVMKLFCDTCEEAICRDCTIVKHRDHKYTFVKDAFSRGQQYLSNLLCEATAKAAALSEAVDGVLAVEKNVCSCAEETVQEIINCFAVLAACLEDRQGEMIDKVEEIKNAKLKSLEIQKEALETALASVQSSVEFTERAFNSGSQVEILNIKKQISSRLRDLNSANWQLKPCVEAPLIKFKVDDQVRQCIASAGVVTDVLTCASMSTVTMENGPDGVMYSTLCDQPVKFMITARDQNGNKRKEGGDVSKVFFSCHVEEVYENAMAEQELQVYDDWNGTYRFSHTPRVNGQYLLSVLLNGLHVQGSPFEWVVEKWNLQVFRKYNTEGQLHLSEENLMAQFYKTELGPTDFTFGADPIYNTEGQLHLSEENLMAQLFKTELGPTDFTFGADPLDSMGQIAHRQNLNGNQWNWGNPLHQHSGFKSPVNVVPHGTASYAVGSAVFSNGKHMWKVLIHGILKGFSFGVVNIFRGSNGDLSNLGRMWVWDSPEKDFEEEFDDEYVIRDDSLYEEEVDFLGVFEGAVENDCGNQDESEHDVEEEMGIPQFVSGDVAELYLDLDDGTLMVYNAGNAQLYVWDGIEGEVSPVFCMSSNGDKVSLKL